MIGLELEAIGLEEQYKRPNLPSIIIYYMHHSPTGNKTLLHNLLTSSKNGSSIALPKNLNSSAGVNAIPAILLMTVLHSAVATLPPLADVNSMHMLIVVGKHVRMSTPPAAVLAVGRGGTFRCPW